MIKIRGNGIVAVVTAARTEGAVDKLAETGEIEVEMINHNGRSGLQLRFKKHCQMTTGTVEDQTWKLTRGFHA